MSEILNVNDFEANQGKIGKLAAADATINALTADIVKLKNQIELLSQEFKIVKDSKELVKISPDKTEIKNDLYARNELVSLPIGTIVAFCGKKIPAGWLICNGAPTNGHPKLKEVIGDYIPNLKDRFIMGLSMNDHSNIEWGNRYDGNSSITLIEANLPSHTHPFSYTTQYYRYEFGKYDKDSGFGRTTTTLDGYKEIFQKDNYKGKTEDTENSKSSPINITPLHFKLLYIIKAE